MEKMTDTKEIQAIKKRLVNIEYKDGCLYWTKMPEHYHKGNVGDRVGSDRREDGYRRVHFNGKSVYEHRIVFFMHHGYLPEYIDHINGNRSDNRIENLRIATRSQNKQNSKKYSNNTSGIKNVFFNKENKKWRVVLSLNGKTKHFGYYEDIELAELVAMEAREKYHGEFARHK